MGRHRGAAPWKSGSERMARRWGQEWKVVARWWRSGGVRQRAKRHHTVIVGVE